MSYGSKIIGTGVGFPAKIMKNAEFESFIDTNDEWIQTRTGIKERRIAAPEKGENTLTMAEAAARKALDMAGLEGAALDMIVVGTITPESVMPNTANQLQARLGAKGAFSFDLQAACSGFVYALSVADQYIKNGTISTALVVGAETLSTVTNWRDRGTCILFGDGAGAVVIQRTEEKHRVIATKLYSDGMSTEQLYIQHGYSRVPPYLPAYRSDLHTIHMNGREVFKLAVRNMVDASQTILNENNFRLEDVDFFIFHQANMRIIEMCAKTLNIPNEKMWVNLQKYGNTSSATLPVCLDEAWKANAIKRGDLILLATFGGGYTWASGLIRL